MRTRLVNRYNEITVKGQMSDYYQTRDGHSGMEDQPRTTDMSFSNPSDESKCYQTGQSQLYKPYHNAIDLKRNKFLLRN